MRSRSRLDAGRRRPAGAPAATRPRRLLRLLPAVLLLGACLVIGAHPLWLPFLGRFLVVDDGVAPTDAVLPLAGELERVAYAADLVRQGHAGRLVITPLPLETEEDRERYVRRAAAIATRRGVPPDAIVRVPRTATSTYGEASNVRRFVEEQGIGSLLVATSAWHTRRSRIIFRDVFADSTVTVRIVPIVALSEPLPAYRYRPEAWWTTRYGRNTTLSEYLKLAAHVVGVR